MDTYSIYRGWIDGEMMEPHLMHSGLSIGEAIEKSQLGGYVVRDSDGATLSPDGIEWLPANA